MNWRRIHRNAISNPLRIQKTEQHHGPGTHRVTDQRHIFQIILRQELSDIRCQVLVGVTFGVRAFAVVPDVREEDGPVGGVGDRPGHAGPFAAGAQHAVADQDGVLAVVGLDFRFHRLVVEFHRWEVGPRKGGIWTVNLET